MSKVQSVLLPKKYFCKQCAIDWLIKNNFKAKKIDETDNYYRFRQFDPSNFRRFRVKKLDNHIELILGFKS